uniref:Putative UVR domain-containing protein n=1 Tax=Helianthus annuus TaxID=4232 RepID=A0A251SWJ7_HELAN
MHGFKLREEDVKLPQYKNDDLVLNLIPELISRRLMAQNEIVKSVSSGCISESANFIPFSNLQRSRELKAMVITLHPALERRFQPVKLPEEARELEKEPRQITKEKNKAVCGQDFEKAGELRDWGMDLKTQSSTLMEKNKEMSKAKTEAGEEGPTVTEADIQHIISSDIKNT